jgi:hypothetical protein
VLRQSLEDVSAGRGGVVVIKQCLHISLQATWARQTTPVRLASQASLNGHGPGPGIKSQRVSFRGELVRPLHGWRAPPEKERGDP